MPYLTGWDYLVVLVYLVGSCATGLWFARRGMQDSETFIVGGRSMPWWLVGFGLVATCFSSDGPLWIGDMIYRRGIEGTWVFWCLGVGGAFFVFGVAPLWRRSGVKTDVEFLELRYSGRSASVLRGCSSLFYSAFFSVMLMAISSLSIMTILDAATGWSRLTCLIVTMGIAVFYFLFSGLWGVAATSFVQFFVYLVGALVLMVASIIKAGGPGELVTRLHAMTDWPGHRLNLLPAGGTGLTVPTLIFLLCFWSLDNAAQGTYVSQRLFACKDTKQATYAAMLFMGIFFSLIPIPWIFTVLSAKVVLPELTVGQEAYPRMIQFLTPGLRGLLIAAMLAAFMSTYAGLLNWGSSCFVNDFWKRFVVKHASERHCVRAVQLAMVPMALLSGFIAYRATTVFALFVYLWLAYSGYITVKLFRWLWWRVNAWSEVAALASSVLLTLTVYVIWPEWFREENLERYYGHRGLIVAGGATVIWVLVTLLTRPVNADVLHTFCRQVRPFGFWGPVYAAVGAQPEKSWCYVIHGWLLMVGTIFGAMLGIPLLLLGRFLPGAVLVGVSLTAAVLAVKKAGRITADTALPEDKARVAAAREGMPAHE